MGTKKPTSKMSKTINRSLSITSFPMSKPTNFTIYFNKKTSAIVFDVESNAIIKSKNINVRMFRNLNNCKFCNVFFNLETVKNSNHDIVCKFSGLNRVYDSQIYSFMKENLFLNFQDDEDKTKPQNYLLVMGWKLQDVGDDLIFYFIQRKCYNKLTRQNIIRTAGLQFSSNLGDDALEKYFINANERFQKTDIPSFMKELGLSGGDS